MKKFIFALLLMLAPGLAAQSAPVDTLVAPGAVGYGATATERCITGVLQAGWPIKVWYIDPDSASGRPRSHSAVIDSTQVYAGNFFNFVLFVNGGKIIRQATYDGDNNECVYIAGQAAGSGSGGITFAPGANMGEWDDNSKNIALRYLRLRMGNNGNNNLRDVDRFFLGNISGSHSGKAGGGHVCGQMNGNRPTNDFTRHITSQWNLCGMPDEDHAAIEMIGGGDPRTDAPSDSVTIYQNVYFGGGFRGPGCSGGDALGIYRVVAYNWITLPAVSFPGNSGACDMIGMYYKMGPATPNSGKDKYALVFTESSDGATYPKTTYISQVRFSRTGYDATIPKDSLWKGSKRAIACNNVASASPNTCTTDGDTVHTQHRKTSPDALPSFAGLTPDTTAIDNTDLTNILAVAGVYRLLNCDGTWRDGRDAFDAARILEITDSTDAIQGSEYNNMDTVAIASPTKGTACTDTDSDGMPDAYEALYGLNPASAADNNDDSELPVGDGWFNLYEFLEGTNPLIFNQPSGSEVPTSPDYNATWFETTDSARAAYALKRINRDTTISRGGADTIISKGPHPDTVPGLAGGGKLYITNPECIAGDTLMIITTLDTLVTGVDTVIPLTVQDIADFADDHNLDDCTADLLRDRRTERQDPIAPRIFVERWAKPEWGVV